MPKIEYKAGNSKPQIIEVSEATAEGIKNIVLDSKREEERTRWRKRKKESSLEYMLQNGFQICSDDMTPEETIIYKDQINGLYKALECLSERQMELVREIFYNDRSMVSIARELGVGESAIRSRMKKIYTKLKKILAG